MIPTVGPGEFESQLVLDTQVPASSEVATQQRASARAYDELVTGVISAAFEHRALHGRENVPFEGTRCDQLKTSIPRIVG